MAGKPALLFGVHSYYMVLMDLLCTNVEISIFHPRSKKAMHICRGFFSAIILHVENLGCGYFGLAFFKK